MPTEPTDNAGGSGGDSAPTLKETRLYERAIRGGWSVRDELKAKVLARLEKVIDRDPLNPLGDREAIGAARAIMAADKLDLDREKLDHQKATAGTDGKQITVVRADRSIDGGAVPAPPEPVEGEA